MLYIEIKLRNGLCLLHKTQILSRFDGRYSICFAVSYSDIANEITIYIQLYFIDESLGEETSKLS